MPPAFRSPRRISITLPFLAFCALQERSDEEGRSLSNLASYLLESALGRHGRD
jgi:CopG-like RHH_1 or ribbon-helix-helix domain, RHH_5